MTNAGDIRNVNAVGDESDVIVAGTQYGDKVETRRQSVGGPMEEYVDPFLDDTPIEACGIEDPEICESCT